mmetsp:Transcript_67776/g.192379  ORF Transcript_67776/g.192379 Transcript_67776/m.192379 type:complete len:434 (-) Transcript_67776:44-1345(-)
MQREWFGAECSLLRDEQHERVLRLAVLVPHGLALLARQHVEALLLRPRVVAPQLGPHGLLGASGGDPHVAPGLQRARHRLRFFHGSGRGLRDGLRGGRDLLPDDVALGLAPWPLPACGADLEQAHRALLVERLRGLLLCLRSGGGLRRVVSWVGRLRSSGGLRRGRDRVGSLGGVLANEHHLGVLRVAMLVPRGLALQAVRLAQAALLGEGVVPPQERPHGLLRAPAEHAHVAAGLRGDLRGGPLRLLRGGGLHGGGLALKLRLDRLGPLFAPRPALIHLERAHLAGDEDHLGVLRLAITVPHALALHAPLLVERLLLRPRVVPPQLRPHGILRAPGRHPHEAPRLGRDPQGAVRRLGGCGLRRGRSLLGHRGGGLRRLGGGLPAPWPRPGVLLVDREGARQGGGQHQEEQRRRQRLHGGRKARARPRPPGRS